jgi:hypothetical protein
MNGAVLDSAGLSCAPPIKWIATRGIFSRRAIMKLNLVVGLSVLLLAGIVLGQEPAKEKAVFTGKAIAVFVKGESIVPLEQPRFHTVGTYSFLVGQVPNRKTTVWLPLAVQRDFLF